MSMLKHGSAVLAAALLACGGVAHAQDSDTSSDAKKPNILLMGAIRYDNYKFVFNLRGDDGMPTGGLAVDTNLGWKGAEKYVATVPQVFDLLEDPQERYDIFMNNFTERTWAAIPANEALATLMKTYVEYPPRKMQSETYTGPITLSNYQRFKWVREQLEKDGVNIPMPTGN